MVTPSYTTHIEVEHTQWFYLKAMMMSTKIEATMFKADAKVGQYVELSPMAKGVPLAISDEMGVYQVVWVKQIPYSTDEMVTVKVEQVEDELDETEQSDVVNDLEIVSDNKPADVVETETTPDEVIRNMAIQTIIENQDELDDEIPDEPDVEESQVLDLNDYVMVNQIEVAVETGDIKFFDWKYLKPSISELRTVQIQDMIEYAQMIIDNRNQTEEAELMAQLLEIQQKLAAIRGTKVDSTTSGKGKRTVTKLVNPDNPSQYYTVGKHPSWLVKLLVSAGGDKAKEYEMIRSMKQASN